MTFSYIKNRPKYTNIFAIQMLNALGTVIAYNQEYDFVQLHKITLLIFTLPELLIFKQPCCSNSYIPIKTLIPIAFKCRDYYFGKEILVFRSY